MVKQVLIGNQSIEKYEICLYGFFLLVQSSHFKILGYILF